MTAEELQARDLYRKRWLSAFMLLLLVGGSAGYAFLSSPGSDGSAPENVPPDEGYTFTVGSEQLTLRIAPSELGEVNFSLNGTLPNYSAKTLYLDAESDAITSEIASSLGRYASRVQPACYGSCERDVPEVTCSENVIIWTPAEQNSISQQGNCVFIRGDLRAVDAFLYRAFGIA